jgi:hypothetical protein
MGYKDGEFVFVHGYGSGIFGEPYDNKTPQGQVYGVVGSRAIPFWCRDPERRALTLLRYMERRAGLFKQQTGSYDERLFLVTLRLAEIWAKRFEANERRRNDPTFNRTRYVKRGKRKKKVPIASVFQSYSEWLRVTKEFPEFLKIIVDAYFPTNDEELHWDIGQIAYNSGGGSENKSLVRGILMKVNEVGQAIFPEPEPAETESSQSQTEHSKSATNVDKPFFDDLDPENFF